MEGSLCNVMYSRLTCVQEEVFARATDDADVFVLIILTKSVIPIHTSHLYRRIMDIHKTG